MIAALALVALAVTRPDHVMALLEQWRLAEAETAIAELARAHGNDAVPIALEGQLRFLRGEYDAAVEKLREAASRDRSNAAVKGLRDLIQSTADLTREYEKAESEHFVVRYPKGPEEILAPYAIEALEAARAALEADFGWAPPEKVRVEIYGEVADLARVSTLTLREIETSGTIALCKWNRLMIVSPRALVRGYSWLDTLTHEYTHYVVTLLSRNTVPIWLHEGIAKFEERRWRGPSGGGLTPTMEHLLAQALRRNRLIPFAAMHPSMAKLPSQEDTALAFAEVYTSIEFLWKKHGWPAVRGLIDKLRAGASDERAVAEVTRQSFQDWEKEWRRYLGTQKYRLRPGLSPHRLQFKKSAGARQQDAEDDADVAAIPLERAKKFARLAGMLRARGRTAAAVVEYEKAAAQLPAREPVLSNKLARAYFELGQLDRAAAAAQDALDVFPEMPGPHLTLAEIAMKQNASQKAEQHLLAALRQNPFDPTVHCALAELWRAGPRGEREAQACRKLSSP